MQRSLTAERIRCLWIAALACVNYTRMQRLGTDPARLAAVLVTHEHSDHIRGIGPLARKYGVPVVMTAGTRASGRLGYCRTSALWRPVCPLRVGGFEITPVPVAHDAAEPSQFVFHRAGKKLGLLTDLGSITASVVRPIGPAMHFG